MNDASVKWELTPIILENVGSGDVEENRILRDDERVFKKFTINPLEEGNRVSERRRLILIARFALRRGVSSCSHSHFRPLWRRRFIHAPHCEILAFGDDSMVPTAQPSPS